MSNHAENRPPSAAHRWLNCHGSPEVLKLFPSSPTDASTKGDIAHSLLADATQWGVTPNHPDIDIVDGVMLALEYIMRTYREYGKGTQLWTEQQLDIPETGEFGTSDIVMVTPSLIHVIDYKNGYVPVNIRMNPQLLLYLLGAIAKYGERKHYRISVIQPNYVHADGMIRHQDVTPDDLAWFRKEVSYAMMSDAIVAGKHCRESYCPARGTCSVFLAWAQENLQLAYYPGDAIAMTDEQLSEALEQADVLQGWREQLRGEAMRRMLQQDRKIQGYKIVRAKKDRDFRDEAAKLAVFQKLYELGATEDEVHPRVDISVAGVERAVKRIFKSQGRGAWMKGMEAICPPSALQPTNQSLTLEKAIDGRRAYTRGAEFGPIPLAAPENATNATDAISIL